MQIADIREDIGYSRLFIIRDYFVLRIKSI